MESPGVHFRAVEPLGEELKARVGRRIDSIHAVAQRDLERYYTLLRGELRRVNLSEREALLLCDVANWAEVQDAIQHDGLDRKWQVDGQGLVQKLRALTPGQAAAICDALERFWIDHNTPDRIRVVGLIR